MHFKLLIAFVDESNTEAVLKAARESGATGSTLISHARGQGISKHTTFFGLSLAAQRNVLLLLVEEHLSRRILEHIANIGEFDAKPGTGIAIQINVEDAVGVFHQARELVEVVEEKL